VTDVDIEQEIRKFISGAEKIAILGVGNDLRTDDGIGLYIINNLSSEHPNLLIENVGSVPEAFARPIADFGASRIIMVDAADMLKSPGHIELVTKDRIGGIAISTHRMPLSFLMTYLEQQTGGETILLGIQPKSIEFGEGLTPELEEVAQKIISALDNLLEVHLRGLKDV
jgi:hydrogenase 3 maturation protease